MTYSILPNISNLGTVNKEESSKDAGLFFMPMPTKNSDGAIQLDIFGATRTITINGIFTSGDGSISDFIIALDNLVNGEQSVKTYHSDKSGVDYYVLVSGVRWEAEEGGVNKVNYVIMMQEGSM